LEYFENNFTAEYLKASVRADPNLGDLVQREHPENKGGIEKTCNIPEMVQDRTKVTMTDK